MKIAWEITGSPQRFFRLKTNIMLSPNTTLSWDVADVAGTSRNTYSGKSLRTWTAMALVRKPCKMMAAKPAWVRREERSIKIWKITSTSTALSKLHHFRGCWCVTRNTWGRISTSMQPSMSRISPTRWRSRRRTPCSRESTCWCPSRPQWTPSWN